LVEKATAEGPRMRNIFEDAKKFLTKENTLETGEKRRHGRRT
jgi:hypothetical protein